MKYFWMVLMNSIRDYLSFDPEKVDNNIDNQASRLRGIFLFHFMSYINIRAKVRVNGLMIAELAQDQYDDT